MDNCKRNHHILLHDPPTTPTNGRTYTASIGCRCVTFGFIRLNVIGEDGAIQTKWMAKGAIQRFSVSLARQLRMPSRWLVSLPLDGAAAIQSQNTSPRVCFKLRSKSGETLRLQDTTLETVARPVRITSWDQLNNQWPHLRDLPLWTRIDVLRSSPSYGCYRKTEWQGVRAHRIQDSSRVDRKRSNEQTGFSSKSKPCVLNTSQKRESIGPTSPQVLWHRKFWNRIPIYRRTVTQR